MKKFSPWLFVAFIAAFLAVGIPYWRLSYSDVNLPSSLFASGLFVVVVGAAFVRLVGRSHFLISLLVGVAVPAVVIARVAVDTAQDPTSHNLWPFEVFIAGFLGLAAASTGALVGSIPAFLGRTK